MAPTSELFICLLTGHIVGDFLLQTRKDSASKKNLWILLKHVFLVTLVTYLACGAWFVWQIPLLVFAIHFFLDLVKSKAKLETPQQELRLFLADQAAHISFLYSMSFLPFFIGEINLFWIERWGEDFLRGAVLTSGLVAVVLAGGVMITIMVKPFLNQIKLEKDELGLTNGGRTIGQLERLLIYLFVLLGHLEVIGFLVAAKSVFRFGTLTKAENRKLAEYITIGTMISFAYAIVVSEIVRQVMMTI